MAWWVPLLSLAAGVLQKNGQERRERRDLLNEQLLDIEKKRAEMHGADPFQMAAIEYPGQWKSLRRAQADRTNPLGTALQALSALDSGGGQSNGLKLPQHDKPNSEIFDDSRSNLLQDSLIQDTQVGKTSLDGGVDDLLKRLDEYGIDTGGRRLIG